MSEPRLKTGIWVGAYVRRCHTSDAPAFVTRKGDPDAGAVVIAIDRLDGTQRVYNRARDGEGRLIFAPLTDWVDPLAAQAAIERQIRFDPDLWVIAVESRSGDAFLDDY